MPDNSPITPGDPDSLGRGYQAAGKENELSPETRDQTNELLENRGALDVAEEQTERSLIMPARKLKSEERFFEEGERFSYANEEALEEERMMRAMDEEQMALLQGQALSDAEQAQEQAATEFDVKQLEVREQNTSKLFYLGTVALIIICPVGQAMLSWPLLVEVIERGGGGFPIRNANKLREKYAPYSPGKRIAAKFLLTTIPTVWYTLAGAFALILLVMLIVLSACSSDNKLYDIVLGGSCSALGWAANKLLP